MMSEFEKACSEIEEGNYEFEHENVIEFEKNAKVATVTFCQGRFVSKVAKLAKEYPNEVEIKSVKKGSIVAHLPADWVKISPPKKVKPKDYTEEERKAIGERLALGRAKRSTESAEE